MQNDKGIWKLVWETMKKPFTTKFKLKLWMEKEKEKEEEMKSQCLREEVK